MRFIFLHSFALTWVCRTALLRGWCRSKKQNVSDLLNTCSNIHSHVVFPALPPAGLTPHLLDGTRLTDFIGYGPLSSSQYRWSIVLINKWISKDLFYSAECRTCSRSVPLSRAVLLVCEHTVHEWHRAFDVYLPLERCKCACLEVEEWTPSLCIRAHRAREANTQHETPAQVVSPSLSRTTTQTLMYQQPHTPSGQLIVRFMHTYIISSLYGSPDPAGLGQGQRDASEKSKL